MSVSFTSRFWMMFVPPKTGDVLCNIKRQNAAIWLKYFILLFANLLLFSYFTLLLPFLLISSSGCRSSPSSLLPLILLLLLYFFSFFSSSFPRVFAWIKFLNLSILITLQISRNYKLFPMYCLIKQSDWQKCDFCQWLYMLISFKVMTCGHNLFKSNSFCNTYTKRTNSTYNIYCEKLNLFANL